MKKLGIFILMLGLCVCPAIADYSINQNEIGNIINAYKNNNVDTGKTIRVGIGNQNFSNYLG